MRKLYTVISIALAVFFLSACTGGSEKSATEKESEVQGSSYDKQVAAAPAQEMTSAQSRKTVNFWIDTWNQPDALSYNYIGVFDSEGVYKASVYYVLKGLPVSYCTSLTPPYKIINPEITGDNDIPVMVPAPGVDGVYYSGGDCERYYGQDANTGAYVEYKVPLNAFIQTFSQPMVGEGFNNAIRVDGSK